MCISIMEGSAAICPLSVSLEVAIFRPVATIGFVPTVFIGWGVGLVYDGLSLLVSSVRFICVGCFRFGSFFVFTFSMSHD